MENYLSVLENSLDQKGQVLDEILTLDVEQEKLLKQERLDLEAFDELVDQKDVLADKLTRLDDGFETLYTRVRGLLQDNKEAYRPQIAALKKLISEITEKTVTIQAKEARNKEMLSRHLEELQQGLGQNRRSSKAAYDYYKNMSSVGLVKSQFMDQKN